MKTNNELQDIIEMRTGEGIWNNRQAISHLEGIKEVAKKFGGKVINKRFFNAIRGEIRGCYVKSYVSGSENFMLDFYDSGNEYLLSINDVEGNLLQAMSSGRRLDYQRFCEIVEKEINEREEHITEWENFIETGYEQVEKINSTVRQLNKLYGEIPTEIWEKLKNVFYRVSEVW